MKTLVFDIDETITIKRGPDYTIDSLPDEAMINALNVLYDSGRYEIVLYTARKMESSGHDIGRALALAGPNTFKWLEKYGVKYHKIYFGKPNGTLIDDRALFFNRDKVLTYLTGLMNEQS